jgi:TRAP-type C4-dicarboxylate transport system substrate-binding protein
MTNRLSLFVRGCLMALLLVLMTSGHTLKAQDVIKLSFTTYVPDIAFMQNTKDWLDALEKRSGGRIKIEPRTWGGALFGAAQLLGAAGDGSVDIVWASPTYTPADQPIQTLFNVPFLTSNVDSSAKAQTMLYETWAPAREDFTKNNVVLLFKNTSGAMGMGLSKPITGPEGLAGLKIRAPGKIWSTGLSNAGTVPVQMGPGDLEPGMRSGTIDGFSEIPIGGVGTFCGACAQVVDPGVGPFGMGHLLMNKDSFDALPDDLKALIESMRWEYIIRTAKYALESDAKIQETLMERNIQFLRFSDEQYKAWYDAMKADQVLEAAAAEAEARGVPAREALTRFRELTNLYDRDSIHFMFADPVN